MEFRVVQSTNSEEQDLVPITIQSFDQLTIKLIDDRKKLSSEVWKYYGLLFNGETLINPSRYYCSLCLKDLQDNVSSGLKGGLSSVHNVSITTATGNLKMHLFKGHNVNTFPDSGKDRFDFTNTCKIESKKIYVNISEGMLEPATFQNDLSTTNCGSSTSFGVSETTSEDAHNLVSTFGRLKTSLERHMKNFSSLSILSEIWFNPIISTFYLKISASFVDSKWDTNCYVLCYTPLETITDQSILWSYESVFRKFNLLHWEFSRIHVVCTRLVPHIPFIADQELCIVFLTNKLITKDGLYSSMFFKNLLNKCVDIISKINSSHFIDSNFMSENYDFLHELAEVFFIIKFDEQNPLMNYNTTNKFSETNLPESKHMMRTCVVLHLLKFIFENTNIIQKSLNIIGFSHLCLLETEILCVKHLVKFLELFYELSDIFKNCNNTLIVVPALKNKIREFCKIDPEEESVIVDIKSSIHNRLEDYFQMNYFVKMACILDPSVRDIIDKDDACQMLLNRLKITSNEGEEKTPASIHSLASCHLDSKNGLDLDNSVANGTISKKLKLFESLRPHYQTGECEDNMVKEVKQYMQHVPTIEETEMPLLFWKNHSHKYPNLSLLAREHLSIPASCMPSSSIVSLASLKSQMDLIHANTFRLNTFSYFHNNLQLHF